MISADNLHIRHFDKCLYFLLQPGFLLHDGLSPYKRISVGIGFHLGPVHNQKKVSFCLTDTKRGSPSVKFFDFWDSPLLRASSRPYAARPRQPEIGESRAALSFSVKPLFFRALDLHHFSVMNDNLHTAVTNAGQTFPNAFEPPGFPIWQHFH